MCAVQCCVWGYSGDHPPHNEQGFQEFVASLERRDVYEVSFGHFRRKPVQNATEMPCNDVIACMSSLPATHWHRHTAITVCFPGCNTRDCTVVHLLSLSECTKCVWRVFSGLCRQSRMQSP